MFVCLPFCVRIYNVGGGATSAVLRTSASTWGDCLHADACCFRPIYYRLFVPVPLAVVVSVVEA